MRDQQEQDSQCRVVVVSAALLLLESSEDGSQADGTWGQKSPAISVTV